jgi:aldose sugar dehydrogenase
MSKQLTSGSLTVLLFLLIISCTVDSQDWETKELRTEYHGIRVVRVLGGLEHPWSVAFLPDGRKLVTERPGRLNIVEGSNKAQISGLPEIHAQNQGGLMEVVLHPNYAENGWIYLTYSKSNGHGETATALIRGRLDGNTLVDVEELFVQDRYSGPGRHYGSKLAWMSDGTLLMSIGDRGVNPTRAQDNRDHAGTILRLNDDGSVPSDNPFVNNPDALDEIYSYGHRNIQGLVVNRETDEIWVTEHGPRGGDLLHLIQPGHNYGWPLVAQGLDYRTQDTFPHTRARRMDGVTPHIYEFLPTLAPSGLAIVTSDRFPRWKGDILAGGLRAERIRRLVVREYEGRYEVFHDEELLLGEVGRIRDVREGPDGYIYVLTDHSNGGLYRVEPIN